MERPSDLQSRFDQLGQRVGADMQRVALRQSWVEGLSRGLLWFALLPAVVLIVQLVRYWAGASAAFVPTPLVVLMALLLPVVVAAWRTRRARARTIVPRDGLQAVDRQLGLADRLTSAQDLLERRVEGGFAAAAIEDGQAKLAEAESARLQWQPVAWRQPGRGVGWILAGTTLLLLAAQVALWQHTTGGEPDRIEWQGAVGEALDPKESDTRLLPDPAPENEARQPDAQNPMGRGAEAKPSKPSPDLSDDVKDSSGKSGQGQSAGAQSTSAASQSRSSPSSQGQSSQADKPSAKKPKKQDRKPKPEGQEPEKKQEEEEDAGSTAGRGSSKGSNKNPTTSSWKSKDQVTNEDDQEVEDDEQAEEDEEEQENRGGVQPHMRDRRPPVSRDLQIGFGNRSNPDANGRGGPGQQKKSRGVASLVLGVPIPDRVKGKPGPGPTKVTQERVEPQAESPEPIQAQTRPKRSSALGPLAPLDLSPAMRQVVTAYFLSRRQAPNKP